MKSKILPVRTYIHETLKNFPWVSITQFEAIWAYVDHQLAGRGRGRQALIRSGISPFSDRILHYQLQHANYYLKLLNKDLQRRTMNIDRRRIYQLSFDDTMEERFGEKVVGAAYQYNHTLGGVCHGQTLVDLVVTTDHVLGVDFQLYLPKKYLQRANRPLADFETKIEMVYQLFQKWFTKLCYQGLAPSKIWTTLDCWYACEKLTKLFRQSGNNFLLGLKKDALCHWFGQTARLDQIFNPADKWRYRTDPDSGKKVYFQEKTLNFVKHGHCKVFAIRRGNDLRARYYATNRVKLKPEQLLPRLKAHWRVETMHLDLKDRFQLRGCNSGKETMNDVHWHLSYLVYLLFCQYQHQLCQQGVIVTLPRLLIYYQYHYDAVRAQKCFSSPSRRFQLQQLLVSS